MSASLFHPRYFAILLWVCLFLLMCSVKFVGLEILDICNINVGVFVFVDV